MPASLWACRLPDGLVLMYDSYVLIIGGHLQALQALITAWNILGF